MKALTTTGLTQLIQLVKDNYTATNDLATVATTGDYSDLNNTPTINDLTTQAQQDALNSNITSSLVTQIGTNSSDISTINGKIPSAATTTNQLADKDFVNSTVTTLLARYITSTAGGDSFATHATLAAGPYYLDGTAVTTADLHNNDYAMVMADETHDGKPARYIWSGSQWSFQYVLNNTTFTQAQVDALNSNITANAVNNYDSHLADTTIHVTSSDKTTWNNKRDKATGSQLVYTVNSSGNQSTLTYTSNATASTIAYRTTGGVLSVGTPTANAHATTKQYVDNELSGKQATLVSGTNIKTINNNSILGSGNITIDSLPSQSGNAGKYLTTDGTDASWVTPPTLPSQSGQSGKYLTTDGTDASWSDLANVAESGDYTDLSNKPKFNGIELGSTSKSFYGVSESLAEDTLKEVEISTITELEVGQVIIVQPTTTSSAINSTLQLNSFTDYPMIYNDATINATTAGIVWAANVPTWWLFNGTSWVFLGHGLDKDTTYTALSQTYSNAKVKAGSGSYSISRYSLIAEKPDGTWEKITNTSNDYSTATTKTVNTSGFVLGQIKYYGSTANVASGVNTALNTVYEKVNDVDMRYSTNCGNTPGWTDGKYIYLVGTIGVDGFFHLDTTTWWTQVLPSTNDGKVYVQLGRTNVNAAAYKCGLDEDHPVFYHDGTSVKEYKVADNKQDKLISGTNLKTINSTTLLGSGDISITGLPSQSGQSGKFLITDGSSASWSTIVGIDCGTMSTMTKQITFA